MSLMSSFGCSASSYASDAISTLPDNAVYGYTYETHEYLDDDTYHAFLADGGEMFAKLMRFMDSLHASDRSSYVSISRDPIEIVNTDIPDICLVNYGTEYQDESRYEIEGERACAAETLQVSDGFFDLFPAGITEGRTFNKGDHDYHGDAVRVLAGECWKDVFSVGDTFEGYYLFERFTFEIIGFFDRNAYYFDSSCAQVQSLERYIIMPFADIREDSRFARIVLLQKMNGMITCEAGRDEAVKLYQDLLKQCALEDWISLTDISTWSILQKSRGEMN